MCDECGGHGYVPTPFDGVVPCPACGDRPAPLQAHAAALAAALEGLAAEVRAAPAAAGALMLAVARVWEALTAFREGA